MKKTINQKILDELKEIRNLLKKQSEPIITESTLPDNSKFTWKLEMKKEWTARSRSIGTARPMPSPSCVPVLQ